MKNTHSKLNQGPQPPPWFPKKDPRDESSDIHRLTIGGLGGLLPFILIGLEKLRHFEGAELHSLSAYYYTGGVAAFAGVLFALSVYFFTYRGYKNERKVWDRLTAILAGLAAIGVAFFPTKAPVDSLRPSWWNEANGFGHLIAAGILFACFAFFALVLFPWKGPRVGPPSKWNPLRGWIYRICGVVILLCMGWIGLREWEARATGAQAWIFWQESVALWAFAVSWIVKAKAEKIVQGLYLRKHYLVHPHLLLRGVKKTLLE